MSLAEVIYQKSLGLPDDKAQEVIDFIESLMARSSGSQQEQNIVAGLEERRRMVKERLSKVCIHWEGKPIPNRAELYDNARS